MQQYLLSLLIFTPLAAAGIALCIPSVSRIALRLLAVGVSVIQVAVLSQVVMLYDPSASLQFVEQKPWISLDLGSWGSLQAQYFVGVDGLNIVFLCLTVFVMLITTLASQGIERNIKGY